MALTNQEKNFVERERLLIETLINLYFDIKRGRLEWDQNDFFNQIEDADLLEDANLAHIDAATLTTFINGLDAIVTTLEANSSEHLNNLIKSRG